MNPALAIQQRLADRLVFSKWREGVVRRLRYFVSGGAPLSPALSYAFLAAGIPILQGYGATETCIVSANRPGNNQVGSVGLPFEGIEVAIAKDGESYFADQMSCGDTTVTRGDASVLSEQWFATGDVGPMISKAIIHHRSKEDLSNSRMEVHRTLKQIESLLKQSEFVSQVVVVGAGRKHLQPLLSPNGRRLGRLEDAGEEFPGDREALAKLPAAVKLVQSDIALLTRERLIMSEFGGLPCAGGIYH